MGDVVAFGGITIGAHEPDAILEAAKGKGLERVLIVGRNPDGSLWFSGSHSDVGNNLLLLKQAEIVLLELAKTEAGSARGHGVAGGRTPRSSMPIVNVPGLLIE